MLSDSPYPTTEIPASPPAEVLDAMTRAAQIADDLEASGRRVSFALRGAHPGVVSELTDADGIVLATLSPRDVLKLACPTET